jgi:hypothetical protein
MTDALLAQLADFGALGLFAAFLLYQHFSMQKRLDALVEKFQVQLSEIQARCDAGEEKLRERYDKVVEQYRLEAVGVRDGLARSVEENGRKLDAAIEKLNG